MEDRVKVKEVKVLSDDWYVLKKTIFDFRRREGSWQTLSRETYDRGNGATILLFNRARKTVLLTRQFRFPAFVNGCKDGMLIEACAGLLENEEAEDAVTKLFEAYMSPGSVTEKLHFFFAEYDASSKKTEGGGDAAHGEEIEVLELELEDALKMIEPGEIQDGKTIILLQYAKLMTTGCVRPERLDACSDLCAAP
jgi:nudix-type nucleoside diphosphatase (YffH/AdpP family)